ncbi:serine hydrolase [Streptomyces sp. NPDC085944]|uniref:serine hydrolase n=1 Tax=Streptomyces sp. NPDC085944 TaxID=3154962 RepID=UPI0034193AE7
MRTDAVGSGPRRAGSVWKRSRPKVVAGTPGFRRPGPSSGRRVHGRSLDPFPAWAAGRLVTTPRDLNRFLAALPGGEVLGTAELKEMRTTVPEAEGAPAPGTGYGPGPFRTPLSCGVELWGHGGSVHGYQTYGGATRDGRAATVATTALSGSVAAGGCRRRNAAKRSRYGPCLRAGPSASQ